jgi:hypothetical protein
MRSNDGLTDADIPTVDEIKLGLALFALTLVIGSLMAGFTLYQLGHLA